LTGRATAAWSGDVAVPDGIPLHELAREVAALLRTGASAPTDQLLTANDVAERFNVDRGWVYAHAHELGAIRIGDGARPRLRFDPAIVAQHELSRRTPVWERRRAPAPTTTAPLLPITPSRRRLAP
jgi:hypothetical protein